MSIDASPSSTAAAAEEMLAAAGAATADETAAATTEREPALDDERDTRFKAELGGEPGAPLAIVFTCDRLRTGDSA